MNCDLDETLRVYFQKWYVIIWLPHRLPFHWPHKWQSLAWTYCFARFWTYYYWWSWICWHWSTIASPSSWKLKLINKFGDIIVVIVRIIIWNVHSSKLEAKHKHKHFLVTNKTLETFGKMMSSCFPCEWNVDILHKGNGRMRRNYQAIYLRRQKKQGLHSKTSKNITPLQTNHEKKFKTILIHKLNQWAPCVNIKKSPWKMKKNGNKAWVCNKYMKRKDTQPFSYPTRWVGYSGLPRFLTYMISRLKIL